MTTTTKPQAETAVPIENSLTAGRLPTPAPWIILGAAILVGAAIFGVLALADGSEFNWGSAIVVGALLVNMGARAIVARRKDFSGAN